MASGYCTGQYSSRHSQCYPGVTPDPWRALYLDHLILAPHDIFSTSVQPLLGPRQDTARGTTQWCPLEDAVEATDPYVTVLPFGGTFLSESTVRKRRASPKKLICYMHAKHQSDRSEEVSSCRRQPIPFWGFPAHLAHECSSRDEPLTQRQPATG